MFDKWNEKVRGMLYLDSGLILDSNKEMIVENCRRIEEYNEVFMQLLSGDLCVQIWGSGLRAYDYRTGVKHTMATKPMTREHLQDFVDCYCSGHMEDRKETYNAETNPNGRWRRYSAEEVAARDDLNFKWIDFTEEDDRSVSDILEKMQEESDGIAAAVAQLKELLGGIEI